MLEGKKAVVVGASRGLGRGVAESLSEAGASVLAIARQRTGLDELEVAHPSLDVKVADATDPTVAGDVLYAHDPDILAVVAGATPLLHPIHHHTWETFSLPWNVDVRIAFNWLREALLKPLRPGSRVLLMSSGAATNGSPMSGGYAGGDRPFIVSASSSHRAAMLNPPNASALATTRLVFRARPRSG